MEDCELFRKLHPHVAAVFAGAMAGTPDCIEQMEAVMSAAALCAAAAQLDVEMQQCGRFVFVAGHAGVT